MAIYHYKPGSLIDEVQILTNDSGGRRAYLFARPDATAEQLEQVKVRIASLGWKAVPYLYEGRPALEVRGFKKAEVMEGALRANGWVHEPASVESHESDKRSTKEKFENATLKATGVAYNVGDVAFMTYAIKERNYYHRALAAVDSIGGLDAVAKGIKKAEFKDNIKGARWKILAGVGYALGGIVLSAFGSRDQSQNVIKATSKKVQQFARKEGLENADETSSVGQITQKRELSTLGKVRAFVARYPSETLNGIYTGVGLLLMAASIKHRNAPQKSYETLKGFKERRADEAWDIGLGVVTATSAMAGLLIKEKKPEEGEEKRGGIGGVIDWIREKPLRATGFGFMLATAFHAKGTWNKLQKKDPLVTDTVKGRAVFVGANVIAEILMTLSSKGHGSGVKPDESVDHTVIAATADLIARQPLEKRDEMVHQFAGYIASPDVLGGQADEHAAAIRVQIDGLKNNPWANHLGDLVGFAASAATQPILLETLAPNKPATKVTNSQYLQPLHGTKKIEANVTL